MNECKVDLFNSSGDGTKFEVGILHPCGAMKLLTPIPHSVSMLNPLDSLVTVWLN